MAAPISAIECLEIVKFAYDLCQSCKAAKDEWVKVGQEVNATRSVIELVQISLDDSASVINKLDDKKKTTHKQLTVHIRNCEQALKGVDKELAKYNRMNAMQRLKWALNGEDVCNDLMANLSSFQTQLDSYVNALNMKGIAAMYKNQASLRMGIGRIEELLEVNGGNPKAAVKNVMMDVQRTCSSPRHSDMYRKVFDDYAHQAIKMGEGLQVVSSDGRDRGRRASLSTLAAPSPQRRSKSEDQKRTGKAPPDNKRSSSVKSVTRNKGNQILECWLVQHKTGDALVVRWQFSEKELQVRGQRKLEQMAKQFRRCKGSRLRDDHDLVGWVVQDRQKQEQTSKIVWQPYAAKIEPKGDLSLNLGVEEQAMVIIKRELTSEEKAKAEAKDSKERQTKDAAKKKKAKAKANEEKAKKIAVAQIEKKWKEKLKAKDAKAKADNDKRRSKIDELRHEIRKLKGSPEHQESEVNNKPAIEEKI